MKLNPDDLKREFDKFASTPEGHEWLANIGTPGWLLLIASALQAFCGWMMLFTIVGFPKGLRWIASGISFRPYRQALRKQINENIQSLQVISACGIIVGPDGAALVLGSFSPIEIQSLAALARQFAELYRRGSDDSQLEPLVALLRDDVYQPNRRRRVPKVQAQGHELYLFDIRLEVDECGEYSGHAIMGLLATSGESGVHAQIPWKPIKRVFESTRPDKPEQFKSDHRQPADGRPGATEGMELEAEAYAATFVEHLEQLGTVDFTPLTENIQGHPPLKIHIVTDDDNDKYLVTEGMSSRPMVVPPDGADYQYAELSLFLRDNWPLDSASLQQAQYRWPVTWLRKIARYPHQNQTWLGGRYAIIANDEPPRPLGPNTELTCLLLIVNPSGFGRWLREDGQTVVFYDVIPLYTEERDYELQNGIHALMLKFEAYGISPWLNPRRVNTCLLSEADEAAVNENRSRLDNESGTYALAARELDSRLKELNGEIATPAREPDADGLISQPSRNSPRGKLKSKYTARVERNDQGEIIDAWWIEFLQMTGNAIAVLAVATLIGLLFPPLAVWLMVGFVLAAIGLLVRAWVLPFRHALRHDKSATVLFIFPWYFIKYGIRNWPQTRPSVLALGLFLVWVCTPILIGPPIQLIARFFQPAPPNGPVVANANPRWEDLAKPAGTPEARPRDPDVSPTRIHQEQRPDGMIVMTITWADGTVGTWVRPVLSQAKRDGDHVRQQALSQRSEGELYLEMRRAEVGAVIVAEVRGSEAGFIYGGQDGIYSMMSSPGPAAVHAGLVKVDQSAKIKIKIVPRPARFPMLKQNGLISISQGPGSEQTAYQIELAKDGEVSADAPATDLQFGRRVPSFP